MNDRQQQLRLIEALLFAAAEPLDEAAFTERLPEGVDVPGLIAELGQLYANRGVQLVAVGKKWAFRTAPDLAAYLRTEKAVPRKFNRATVETLAVIAYHQPITRPEIEEIRGVSLSKGTLDVLLEAGWIKPGRHRETPGRPVTWVTTEAFLDHFGLANIKDLPGIEELKAAGLLDKRPAIAAYGAALSEEQIAQAQEEAEAEAEEEEASLEELAVEEDTRDSRFETAARDGVEEGIDAPEDGAENAAPALRIASGGDAEEREGDEEPEGEAAEAGSGRGQAQSH